MKKNELKTEALKLFNKGLSYGKIAEQLGVGKTTVYYWVVNSDIPTQNGQKTKKVVPNEIMNEQNELEDIKKELQYDFGTDKDIEALVELRKAELEYQLKMETIEFEREKLLQAQKNESNSKKEELLLKKINEINSKLEAASQKSERIQSEMAKIKNENEELTKFFQKKAAGNVKIELNTGLQNDCSDNIREYLALEDEKIILRDVETVLENNETLINAVAKWCKANNKKKSNYPELSFLKEIKKSLKEMTEDFEDDEDVELEFDFNSDFTKKLKDFL